MGFDILKSLMAQGVEMVIDSIDGTLQWPISGMIERFSLV